MACGGTTSNSTIERTLPIRGINTNQHVFQHTFLDPVHFTTMRAWKTLNHLRCINTMFGLMVLLLALRASILLTTVRTLHLVTLDTSFNVSQHFPAGQYLTTPVTWELLSSVHPHVFHQTVVGFKGLLAHWTVLGLSRNSWQLVGDFSNLPDLSTLRKVFPMKKSWNMLLGLL